MDGQARIGFATLCHVCKTKIFWQVIDKTNYFKLLKQTKVKIFKLK